MKPTKPITGYFGKVPMRGDFITQGLPHSFTEPWHEWIKQSLSCCKQQLGDDWRVHYLTTPIYHYVLSSGVCGDEVWLGVVIPSVDSVGRNYPLTICRSVPSSSSPVELPHQYQHWINSVETLLLSALDKNASLEGFQQEFQHLEIHKDLSKPLPTQITELEKRMETLQYKKYSLWSTQGSELISPSIVIANSLPEDASVVAFMDGHWDKWGWSREQILLQ